MFSVFTIFITKNVCTTNDTAHIDMIFKFLPHTRQHEGIDILHCCNCLYHALMVLCVGWYFAYSARNARCAVTTDLLVWYSNTQNNFSPRAAIFSLHTLASSSGRSVNYDEKQLKGGKNWVFPSICTGFLNTCPTVFLSSIFVTPEYIMKRPVCRSFHNILRAWDIWTCCNGG
jgi:hypothetical protein